MIDSIKKITAKNFLVYISLVIIFSFSTNFFYNTYFLYKYKYEDRMSFVYGNCTNESYGYVSKIFKENKFKDNVKIVNLKLPLSQWFFYKVNRPYDSRYMILLNYFDLKKPNFVFDNNKYQVIDKFENCFFLRKIND